MSQKTIRKSISCSGIGLHSGRTVRLTLRPAPADSGILFCLGGESGRRFLKPTPHCVHSTALATTLTQGDEHVSTVEHLLAAVRGLGIDNLRIEVDGPEVPIMDGSAASFVYLLRQAGIVEQDAPRTVLAVTRPVIIRREGKYVRAEPYDGFRVDYTIDFPHPLIGRQTLSFDLTPELFIRRVAKARTFGFLRDVEMMRERGLALGGSLDNAVVLDEFGVLNEDGLRFKDEFIRHKVLDFIGDMALAEFPLQGRFEVFAGGHALHNEFLRHMVDNAEECLETVVERGEPLPLRRPAAVPAAVSVTAA